MDVFELADRLVKLRSEKEVAAAEAKVIGDEIKDIEEKLVEAMVEKDMQNFSRAGKLFHLRSQNFVSVRADRRELLNNWLREHGWENLVSETVHPSTLKGFVNELLDESDELPDGLADIVSTHTETKIGVRAAT